MSMVPFTTAWPTSLRRYFAGNPNNQKGGRIPELFNKLIYNANEDYVSGNVSLRAKPDWIETFLAAIDEATEKAGGEVTSRSTRADDLTRQIIDTDSRLEAQKTLQTRLEGLLERRDGTLGDLLQIERELARVTGDIESIEAWVPHPEC